MASIDISKLFADEANSLVEAREKCIKLHGTDDIRSAGDEVEISVREFFQRNLPKRFYVTHGHLIDHSGAVSPQIDLIVSDNTTIPALMRAKDGTEYIPIDSVYAIGEIKSSFYKSKNYISDFSDSLKYIRTEMNRSLVENTIHGGVKNDSLLRDMVLGRPNKHLNSLFSFIFFVSSGDFTIESLEKDFSKIANEDLPSMIVFLDGGVVFYGKKEDKKLIFEKYPALNQSPNFHWYISPLQGVGVMGTKESVRGNHLGMIYLSLLNHLNESFLEPPNLRPYLSNMLVGRGTTLIELKKKS